MERGPTQQGKGKLFIDDHAEPVAAYYELAKVSEDLGPNVTGHILTEPAALAQIESRPEAKLVLDNGNEFIFKVQKLLLLDRPVAGKSLKGVDDTRPSVARVTGNILAPLVEDSACYHDLEDLFEGELPWVGESGKKRIESAALKARAMRMRGNQEGGQPPAGFPGSEVLPSRVLEEVFGPVATEFEKADKLSASACTESIPRITFQVLRTFDPPAWRYVPYGNAFDFMHIAMDECSSRYLDLGARPGKLDSDELQHCAETVTRALGSGISKTAIAKSAGFDRRTLDRLLKSESVRHETAACLAQAASQLLTKASKK